MFHVVKILLSHARSFKVIENGIPFESLGIVSYLLSISTMAVSLAVSTQYTNVIRQRHPVTAQQHRVALMHSIARQKS